MGEIATPCRRAPRANYPTTLDLFALGNLLAIAAVILAFVSVFVALGIYEYRVKLQRKSAKIDLGVSLALVILGQTLSPLRTETLGYVRCEPPHGSGA